MKDMPRIFSRGKLEIDAETDRDRHGFRPSFGLFLPLFAVRRIVVGSGGNP